jgi:TRAP-type C4-dicarboxylate transport system substrate-binding protein
MICFKSTLTGMACLFAATLLGGTAFAQSRLPETQLNLVGSMSIQPATKAIEQPFWNTRIPQRSAGALKVRNAPWNELGLKGSEVFHLIRQGVYDGGALVMAFSSGEVPINDGWDLAGLSPTVTAARESADLFFPVIARHYERNHRMKLLTAWPFPPQVLFCKQEVKGLDSVRGRKVRTSTASQADFVRAMGGTDVNVAFGEVQSALQSGVVDCAITSAMSAYKAGWYEAAKYYFSLPINWQFIVFGMNLNKWNALSPQVQQFLSEEVKFLAEEMWKSSPKEHEDGVACLTGGTCAEGKPASMQKVDPRPEDLALLKDAFPKAILPRWVKACGDACVADWNATIGRRIGITATVAR